MLVLALTGCNSATDTPADTNTIDTTSTSSSAYDENTSTEMTDKDTTMDDQMAQQDDQTTDSTSEMKDSLYDYLKLTVSEVPFDTSKNAYETTEPKEVVLIGKISTEGTDWSHTEFWGMEGWDQKDPEEVQNFYIKRSGSQPNGPETITWYGPFKGMLGKLLEEAKTDKRLVVEME